MHSADFAYARISSHKPVHLGGCSVLEELPMKERKQLFEWSLNFARQPFIETSFDWCSALTKNFAKLLTKHYRSSGSSGITSSFIISSRMNQLPLNAYYVLSTRSEQLEILPCFRNWKDFQLHEKEFKLTTIAQHIKKWN